MKNQRSNPFFQKILVPVVPGCDHEPSLTTARAISEHCHIVMAGVVYIPEGESLSGAAVSVRQLRKSLQDHKGVDAIRIRQNVHASHNPWKELMQVVEKEQPDLLLLAWPCQFEALHTTPAEVFAHPPCDIAIFSGSIPAHPECVLVPVRGGPYAELALRVAISLARTDQTRLTTLHIASEGSNLAQDSAYRGIDRILKSLPMISQQTVRSADHVEAILEHSRHADLVVIGASAQSTYKEASIGAVAERILHASKVGVIVVKTRRPLPASFTTEETSRTAISVLVDKWFAENTYHADDFHDLNALLELKKRQNLTVSLALPALNEEETVGNVVTTIRAALMDSIPLLDEIILVDSDSSDATREIVAGLDIPVYIHQSTLPQYGVRHGKGEALWKSLYLTRGDIILWIDTDIVNIAPRFVYGLLGPLLVSPEVQFIKGFYRRPLRVDNKLQMEGGGRVTELAARPLINLFYPELSGLVQPLAGEYGGRRSLLEQLPFCSGYGVEIGLLIDTLEKLGLNGIAQVDLLERIHHNQPLEALGKMSFSILQAVMHRLERRHGMKIMDEANKAMKLIRYEPGRFYLDVQEIVERERPPMLEIPEYVEKRKGLHHSISNKP